MNEQQQQQKQGTKRTTITRIAIHNSHIPKQLGKEGITIIIHSSMYLVPGILAKLKLRLAVIAVEVCNLGSKRSL